MKSQNPLATRTRTFRMRFSATRRGARLARHLAAERLDIWGHPYGSDLTGSAELIVGELCANAVHHGHVAGRDFELYFSASDTTIRIEVSDARDERYPPLAPAAPPQPAESGYGLLLVATLADAWGAVPRTPLGKTIWAQITRASFDEALNLTGDLSGL